MKKTAIVFAVLAIALVGFVAALRFSGDIGVNTRLAGTGFSKCWGGQKPYMAFFNITNYNISNATATNVSYWWNVTDDGISVFSAVVTRYLAVGETYSWSVGECTIGNQTNHSITSYIYKYYPADSYSGNDYDTDSIMVG